MSEEVSDSAQWYVVHTYAGHENKVKANLEKIVENSGLQDAILDIVVPMEEQIEIKDGRKRATLKKVFPGYALIKMILTDESWHVVRNTRGVTGFVGSGSKPIPLTDKEIREWGVEETVTTVDYEVNDSVMVTSGPLKNFIGVVEEVNMERRKVKVIVSMFGRETPVELELEQIQKI